MYKITYTYFLCRKSSCLFSQEALFHEGEAEGTRDGTQEFIYARHVLYQRDSSQADANTYELLN